MRKAEAVVQDAEAYQNLLDIAAQADVLEGIRQGTEDRVVCVRRVKLSQMSSVWTVILRVLEPPTSPLSGSFAGHSVSWESLLAGR